MEQLPLKDSCRFVESWACRSKAHCSTCLSDSKWRTRTGAPDDCPEGFTAENPPPLQPPPLSPGRPAGLAYDRLAICKKCGQRSDCNLWRQKKCYIIRVLAVPLMCCPADTPCWRPVGGSES